MSHPVPVTPARSQVRTHLPCTFTDPSQPILAGEKRLLPVFAVINSPRRLQEAHPCSNAAICWLSSARALAAGSRGHLQLGNAALGKAAPKKTGPAPARSPGSVKPVDNGKIMNSGTWGSHSRSGHIHRGISNLSTFPAWIFHIPSFPICLLRVGSCRTPGGFCCCIPCRILGLTQGIQEGSGDILGSTSGAAGGEGGASLGPGIPARTGLSPSEQQL